MTDKIPARLGAVEETLFIPLAARARETGKKHPLLRDAKAVEVMESIDIPVGKYHRGWGSVVMVLRTTVFDAWVKSFLDHYPTGTVIEIGTGLNTRFERVDNGVVRWFDLDLPDTIELRSQFFANTDRRRMLAASVLDENWIDQVSACPGPYFFVAEGVLVYLPEDHVRRTLSRIVERFPDSSIAFDTYNHRMMQRQHQRADQGDMNAKWAWACDDPRSLESLGLQVIESTTVTRPPGRLRRQLPMRYRIGMPFAQALMRATKTTFQLTLFKTPPAT
ncbi:MAG TPA: class I SAM-dependent methyltransferase [Mycobacterium sp.]|nr:class I SAM-dependent methyltransferase [Mycobacterium sp.]HUH69930.1 class I SAM-dependent methyltransferase [Mycobacterium sp.]